MTEIRAVKIISSFEASHKNMIIIHKSTGVVILYLKNLCKTKCDTEDCFYPFSVQCIQFCFCFFSFSFPFLNTPHCKTVTPFLSQIEPSLLSHKISKYYEHFKEAAPRFLLLELKKPCSLLQEEKFQEVLFSYSSMNNIVKNFSDIFPIVNQISFQTDYQKMLALLNIWAQKVIYWKS